MNITVIWGFFKVLKCHKNGNMQDVSYKLEQVLALAMNQFLVLCLLLQFLIALCFLCRLSLCQMLIGTHSSVQIPNCFAQLLV